MALDWDRDGRDWPHREASFFAEAAGLRWHVQRVGTGPGLLLLHGTGASTHSWRDLMPRLAPHFDVLAVDLPGHAFTQAARSPAQSTLPGIAQALAALLRTRQWTPRVVVGHSAGAAIAARMALDGPVQPALLVGLNGAWLPFGGAAGAGFSAAARLLAAGPWLPRLFAWAARDPARVRRLIEQTGSRIDEAGLALYGRLVSDPAHATAALQMMARWDLVALQRELPRLQPPLSLIVGDRDLAVPPAQSRRMKDWLPATELVTLPGLGHLAHEERPDWVADAVLATARRHGVVAREDDISIVTSTGHS